MKPVTPFLGGQVFDPETLEAMGAAFHEACIALGLVDRADTIAERVAKRVIELASRGIRTKTALYQGTVQMFKAAPQEVASAGLAPQPAYGDVARPAKPA